MEVFEFKKSLLVRQQEAFQVLSARDDPIPASTVQKEWALFLEVAMEPTGWQALWRIPRLVCQELSTKFPTIVMGTVEKVLFDDLKAILVVEAVENDDFHLPEKQVIPLCDLWPLKHQRNEYLNIDRTADCIDQLRFFYQHVWMPWDYDNDEDQNWPEKHLESRIKFYCDLKNRTMPRRLTCHVLNLLDEANQLQKKRELFALAIEEEDGTDPSENNTDLLNIRLRLNSIKNEIETLEFFAPEMRTIYERVRFPKKTFYSEDHLEGPSICIITLVGTLEDQIEYLETTKKTIGHQKLVEICDSLQEALDRNASSSDIYLPPGQHDVKLFEDLNGGGSIQAIDLVGSDRTKTIIRSRQDDNVLLTLSGDYRLENITLDCSNVQTGILVKRGSVTLKNCCLIGDPRDIASNGIVVCGNATIRLEHCRVENFSVGVCANSSCKVQLHNSTVRDCFEGVKIVEGCRLEIASSTVADCRNYGIVLEMDEYVSAGVNEVVECYQDYRLLREWEEFGFEGACQFQNNGNGNFVVFRTNDVRQ